MTTLTLTTRPGRRQSYTDWRQGWIDAIVTMRPIRSASALSGSYGTGTVGRLTGDAWQTWRLSDPSYVIRSYGTPIAWYDPRLGWIMPDTRYSVTTSRHQSIVRSAIVAAYGDAITTNLTTTKPTT